MQITLDISDELAAQLNPVQQQLPQIITFGLRELNAHQPQSFTGLSDVLDFLASLPEPEAILALRPSETLQNDIDRLLDKNKQQGLNDEEERYWQHYQYIEHLVRKTKINAYKKIKQA